jgi:hypothetical protein
MAQLRRRTRCLASLLVPLLHLGSVRYHTMTGSRTRDENDQVLGFKLADQRFNTGQIDMLPAGASSWIHGGGKESPSVASGWDSVPARHAGLHTFSIYLFAYDSLRMMDRLAIAAEKMLGT